MKPFIIVLILFLCSCHEEKEYCYECTTAHYIKRVNVQDSTSPQPVDVTKQTQCNVLEKDLAELIKNLSYNNTVGEFQYYGRVTCQKK
jgi:hypothetical protein